MIDDKGLLVQLHSKDFANIFSDKMNYIKKILHL